MPGHVAAGTPPSMPGAVKLEQATAPPPDIPTPLPPSSPNSTELEQTEPPPSMPSIPEQDHPGNSEASASQLPLTVKTEHPGNSEAVTHTNGRSLEL